LPAIVGLRQLIHVELGAAGGATLLDDADAGQFLQSRHGQQLVEDLPVGGRLEVLIQFRASIEAFLDQREQRLLNSRVQHRLRGLPGFDTGFHLADQENRARLHKLVEFVGPVFDPLGASHVFLPVQDG
jgi:hypothetical protein